MMPTWSAKTSYAAGMDTHTSGRAPLARRASRLALLVCAVVASSYAARAQNVQFTQGSVGSGLNNSIQIPIAAYPGRGAASLPVTLYYSSNVWKISHLKTVKDGSLKQSVGEAVYAEHSAAGWTTSLDVPKVEWPKINDRYWYNGEPYYNFISGETYRVPVVFIHMPDGSSHELRRGDDWYADTNSVSVTGNFYAIDGSRLRYVSTSANTGTLYMTDGSRFELDGADARFVDRNGNALNYDGGNREWTDALGAVISGTPPRGKIAMPWPANPLAGQDYSYTPPGYTQPYVFKWRLLSQVLTTPDAQGQTPQVRAASSHYLPLPGQEPNNKGQSNFPQSIGGGESLFFSDVGDPFADDAAPSFTYVVGRGQGAGDRFDPAVLSEVVLPNGLKYTFTYNIYGEIDKIVYPTGGYERSQYDAVPAMGDMKAPYSEANRGVKFRWVSPNGTGGTDEAQWKYEASLPSLHTYLVKTTAPDLTYTESYRHDPFSPNSKTFGYRDGLAGLAYDERSYDKDGVMLRRTLTKWAQTAASKQGPTPNVNGNIQPTSYTAYRNPRPTRSVSLILDTGGAAIAKRSEYFYAAADPDTVNHTNSWAIEITTGLDRTGVTESHFAEGIDQTTAKTATIDTIWNNYAFPPASSSETAYLPDQGYRDRNILGLITSVVLNDAAAQPVSKTEMFYDEALYAVLPPYGDLGGPDPNYVDPNTTLRGNPTTVRRYANLAANSYLETHAQFDQYGNSVNIWDERGILSQKSYSAAYRHAYLTQTTSAAPDPSGQHGSGSAFTTSSTYEPSTGLVLTTTNVNGQTTSVSYNDDQGARDKLNRPRKVTRPDDSWTKTHYNDVPGNLYVHIETQFDATTNTHAYVFYDKMGRTSRSLGLESGTTYVVTETRYDEMGRASQSSNAFRTTVNGTGSPAQALYWTTADQPAHWTTNTYDALGRVRHVTLPDSTSVSTDYVGVYTTATDQAGRQRRQKTDALGRVVRVDEPDDSGNLDGGDRDHPYQPSFYEYDTLGNVVRINQGLTQQGANPEASSSYTQHRYFKYDALSRLTHEKQAEQAGTISAADPLTGNSYWSRRLTYDETVGGVNNKGLLTTTEDARQVTSTFYYDQLGRTYQTVYSDGTPTVTSKYDQARADAPPAGGQPVVFYNKGQLTEVSTLLPGSVVETQLSYDYDLMGRARRQRQAVGANAYDLRYAYNLGGALVSERYPSGRVVSYGFDSAARLSAVSSGATAYASGMTYKPFGGLESMTLGNGTVYSMSYDDARIQLTSISLKQGASTLQRYDYKYGQVDAATGAVDETKNVGQIARIEGTIGTQRQWQQRFSYDALGRLSSAGEYRGDTLAQSYFLKYGYDVYGNRYQRFQDTPRDPQNNPTNPFAQSWVETGSFDATTNRFTSGVNYDNAGNVISDSRFRNRAFQYDANNRQKQSSNLDGTGAVQSVYNGAGQRVAVKSGGVITKVMVYDVSGSLVAEYGGAVVSNGTRYVMGDQQGSTRVVMASAPVGGQLVASRHDYLPFGEEVAAGVGLRTTSQGYSQDDGVRKKYAGMEGDDATGMSHTLWREYDSLSARWTAPDPYGGSMSLAAPQSFNRYTYVNNDPVNMTDPSGLMPASEGWGSVSNAWGGDPGFNDPHFGGPGVIDVATENHERWVENDANGGEYGKEDDGQQKSGPSVDPVEFEREFGPAPPGPKPEAADRRTEAQRTCDEKLSAIFGGVAAGSGYEPTGLPSVGGIFRGRPGEHLYNAAHIYGSRDGFSEASLFIPAGGKYIGKNPHSSEDSYMFFYEKLGSARNVTLFTSHVANFVAPNGITTGRTRIGDIGGDGGRSMTRVGVQNPIGRGTNIHAHLAIHQNFKDKKGRYNGGYTGVRLPFFDVFCK